MSRIADKAQVFQGSDQLWYVHTVAENGDIILSSEGYKNREWAVQVAEDTGLPVTVQVFDSEAAEL